MKFVDFLTEAASISAPVKVGDTVSITYKSINGNTKEVGSFKVTKVLKSSFMTEFNQLDRDGKPIKFNFKGYGSDYKKGKIRQS